jgi:hypothetical protein
MTEGDTAVHTAAGLLLKCVDREVLVKLVPITDAL